MKTFVLICDLKNEPEAFEAYVRCHEQIDPAILESIRVAGIHKMSICRWEQRHSMIQVTSDDFSFEKKAVLDLANPIAGERIPRDPRCMHTSHNFRPYTPRTRPTQASC